MINSPALKRSFLLKLATLQLRRQRIEELQKSTEEIKQFFNDPKHASTKEVADTHFVEAKLHLGEFERFFP